MRKLSVWTVGMIWLAGPLSLSLSAGPHDDVRNMGSRLELFVDDWLIARMDNLQLAMHRPRPAEVAMQFDRPWEGGYSAYVTVFQDGDRFRMYYRGDRDGRRCQAGLLLCREPRRRPLDAAFSRSAFPQRFHGQQHHLDGQGIAQLRSFQGLQPRGSGRPTLQGAGRRSASGLRFGRRCELETGPRGAGHQ